MILSVSLLRSPDPRPLQRVTKSPTSYLWPIPSLVALVDFHHTRDPSLPAPTQHYKLTNAPRILRYLPSHLIPVLSPHLTTNSPRPSKRPRTDVTLTRRRHLCLIRHLRRPQHRLLQALALLHRPATIAATRRCGNTVRRRRRRWRRSRNARWRHCRGRRRP